MRWRGALRSVPVLALVLGVLALLLYSHWRGHEQWREGEAELIVGYGALLYLNASGAPPSCVEDLFDAGILYVADNGDVHIHGLHLGVPIHYVRELHLSFPNDPTGFRIEAGLVRSVSTGEEVVCLELHGRPAALRDWAYLWFRVANGEPTGIDRLDDLLSNASGQGTQPASVPAP
jgi:hypothetical protein